MIKAIKIIGLNLAIVVGLIVGMPGHSMAVATSVYVSGSSSVTTGNNISATVRISSGLGPMDSVQATLNYDSSRLQYVSYSNGAFSKISASNSSGAFSYVGALLGDSTSGDCAMFTVTFKSLKAGSANLSLSGVGLAYQGSYLSGYSLSGKTITVSDPVVSTPVVTTPSNPVVTPLPVVIDDPGDKTAPKLSGDVKAEIDQHTIKFTFKTDEAAKVKIKYTIDRSAASIEDTKYVSSHDLTIGSDKALIPGGVYKIEFIATDEAGNSRTIYSKTLTTKGVDFKIRITDSNGNPLANHPVQLYSDPINATTDNDGYAIFANVAVGKHTLVFEIDGMKIEKIVDVEDNVVAQIDVDTDGEAEDDTFDVVLPLIFVSEVEAAVDVEDGGSMFLFTVVSILAVSVLALAALSILLRHRISSVIKKLLHRKKKQA